MKRVAIIGSAGAGKSTLAREVGAVLGLEVFHLDALFWRPGWVETPDAEWRTTVEDLARGDSWIIDGNYGRTMDIRLSAADTIVFLDFPRATCLWRVIKRTVVGMSRTRPDMAPGCSERFAWHFIKWVWSYPSRSRPAVLNRIARHSPGRTVHTLRSSNEVRHFIQELAKP